MKKVLFSGSRKWDRRDEVEADVLALPDDAHVIVGDCPTGVDRMVFEIATGRGLPVSVFHADWHHNGRAAGPIRNNLMVAQRPDQAFFYINGKSNGTRHCLNAARLAGVPDIVTVYGSKDL